MKISNENNVYFHALDLMLENVSSKFEETNQHAKQIITTALWSNQITLATSSMTIVDVDMSIVPEVENITNNEANSVKWW